jgi:hypothetical protein
MVPVLRHFASHFTEGQWLPCYPVLADKIHASCWEHNEVRLWTIVNQGDRESAGAVLDVDDRDEQFFDLWRGEPIEPKRMGDELRLTTSLERFGAVAAVPRTKVGEIAGLVEGQRVEAARPVPDNDQHIFARSVLEPRDPPRCPPANPQITGGMLRTSGGEYTFTLRHIRRECGCYPDGEMSADERWTRFLSGNPHSGTIEHCITKTLSDFWIDPRPVTNAEFAVFLKATGYMPECVDKFLHHWGGASCPKELEKEPVVYVDLGDARSYAAWAKKRLPTEWEWQHAAELHSKLFEHEAVHEWTESERDDGHNRFVMLRGGCAYKAEGSIWYFPGGPQPIESHAKFLLLDSGLDRCATIGFRCVSPAQ